MGKRKDKRNAAQLLAQIAQTAAGGNVRSPTSIVGKSAMPVRQDELTMMKKFRFQLLHRWLTSHMVPCRVADVGGGKGLLTYLLQQDGWTATVIDPVWQALPPKYKDLRTKKQLPIATTVQVPRIDRPFAPQMAPDFDLLVAMHAHGCNLQIIDAAVQYNCDLILLPCCVIHEPRLPPAGTHWIQWLVELMLAKGLVVEPFELNFKGQNIGLFARLETR